MRVRPPFSSILAALFNAVFLLLAVGAIAWEAILRLFHPEPVAGLTVMGGHVRSVRLGDQELSHGIDYNLCSDPEATVAVLGAGFRTTLVTADVTLQTWIGPADLARLEGAGRLPRAIGAMTRQWTAVQKKLFAEWGGAEPVLTYEDVDVSLIPPRPRLYGLVGAEVIDDVWKQRQKKAAAGADGNGAKTSKTAAAHQG